MNQRKKYKFSYQTIVSYQNMVSNYHFLLRCTPLNLPFQAIAECQLHLLAPAKITNDQDVFGNNIHYGYLNEAHDIFVVASNGIAECDKYMIEESKPEGFYKAGSHLTFADKALSKFNRDIEATGNDREVALSLCEVLHNHMSYTPGSTLVSTTAAKSFELGEGVCQDFAHILISMCRERDIFARYVVGFVVGTGETHAWVEVWCDGVWWGIDPTHNRLIEEGYIKLAHGRDAADCSVIRGAKRGSSAHSTQIRVVVEEL